MKELAQCVLSDLNLDYAVTEDDLRSTFSEDGRSVAEVHVVTDRETGRPRGFAFAEMADDAQAQAVIQAMDGKELDGRNLTVNEAKPREARGGGGGGGQRGGGGRV